MFEREVGVRFFGLSGCSKGLATEKSSPNDNGAKFVFVALAFGSAHRYVFFAFKRPQVQNHVFGFSKVCFQTRLITSKSIKS